MKVNIIGYERFRDKKGNDNIRYYGTMHRNTVTGVFPCSVNIWTWQFDRYPDLDKISIGDNVNFEFGPDGFLLDFKNYGPSK